MSTVEFAAYKRKHELLRTFSTNRNSSRDDGLPKVSVILPAFNEEAGLGAVLEELYATLDASYELIVVDDGSEDATAAVAASYPCRLIRHEVNRGKGDAMQTGALAASSDLLVFIDADGSYPAESIALIVSRLAEADFVIGTRSSGRENIPRFNRLGNWSITQALRLLYGFQEKDPLSGLYGIRKEYFMSMALRSHGFAIEAEIGLKAARMGLKVESIPIDYRERLGESKLRALRDGSRIGATILRMLSLYNPSVAFVAPGLACFAIACLAVIVLAVTPVQIGPALLSTNTMMAAGMLSLAGFQLATFGVALHIYGVLHKFISPTGIAAVVLRWFNSPWMVGIGSTAVLSSISLSCAMFLSWALHDFEAFKHTGTLFLGAFMGVFGMQVLFSGLFLSPLMDDLHFETVRQTPRATEAPVPITQSEAA